jgi:hypothetical protein
VRGGGEARNEDEDEEETESVEHRGLITTDVAPDGRTEHARGDYGAHLNFGALVFAFYPEGIAPTVGESQRDSVPKPRVARHELPWVTVRK